MTETERCSVCGARRDLERRALAAANELRDLITNPKGDDHMTPLEKLAVIASWALPAPGTERTDAAVCVNCAADLVMVEGPDYVPQGLDDRWVHLISHSPRCDRRP